MFPPHLIWVKAESRPTHTVTFSMEWAGTRGRYSSDSPCEGGDKDLIVEFLHATDTGQDTNKRKQWAGMLQCSPESVVRVRDTTVIVVPIFCSSQLVQSVMYRSLRTRSLKIISFYTMNTPHYYFLIIEFFPGKQEDLQKIIAFGCPSCSHHWLWYGSNSLQAPLCWVGILAFNEWG